MTNPIVNTSVRLWELTEALAASYTQKPGPLEGFHQQMLLALIDPLIDRAYQLRSYKILFGADEVTVKLLVSAFCDSPARVPARFTECRLIIRDHKDILTRRLEAVMAFAISDVLPEDEENINSDEPLQEAKQRWYQEYNNADGGDVDKLAIADLHTENYFLEKLYFTGSLDEWKKYAEAMLIWDYKLPFIQNFSRSRQYMMMVLVHSASVLFGKYTEQQSESEQEELLNALEEIIKFDPGTRSIEGYGSYVAFYNLHLYRFEGNRISNFAGYEKKRIEDVINNMFMFVLRSEAIREQKENFLHGYRKRGKNVRDEIIDKLSEDLGIDFCMSYVEILLELYSKKRILRVLSKDSDFMCFDPEFCAFMLVKNLEYIQALDEEQEEVNEEGSSSLKRTIRKVQNKRESNESKVGEVLKLTHDLVNYLFVLDQTLREKLANLDRFIKINGVTIEMIDKLAREGNKTSVNITDFPKNLQKVMSAIFANLNAEEVIKMKLELYLKILVAKSLHAMEAKQKESGYTVGEILEMMGEKRASQMLSLATGEKADVYNTLNALIHGIQSKYIKSWVLARRAKLPGHGYTS